MLSVSLVPPRDRLKLSNVLSKMLCCKESFVARGRLAVCIIETALAKVERWFVKHFNNYTVVFISGWSKTDGGSGGIHLLFWTSHWWRQLYSCQNIRLAIILQLCVVKFKSSKMLWPTSRWRSAVIRKTHSPSTQQPAEMSPLQCGLNLSYAWTSSIIIVCLVGIMVLMKLYNITLSDDTCELSVQCSWTCCWLGVDYGPLLGDGSYVRSWRNIFLFLPKRATYSNRW